VKYAEEEYSSVTVCPGGGKECWERVVIVGKEGGVMQRGR